MITTVIVIYLIQGILCQYIIPSCYQNYVTYERYGYDINGIIRIPDRGYAGAQIDLNYITRFPTHQSIQLIKPIESDGNYIELYLYLQPYEFQPIIYEIYINGKRICRDNIHYQNTIWSYTNSFYFERNDDIHENYIPPNPRVLYPGPTRGTIIPWARTPSTTPTTTTTSKTPSTTTLPPYNDAFCGYQSIKPFVFGGEEIKLMEFPWLVAMYFNTTMRPNYMCAASLISRTHAITAAHCVANMTETSIYLEFGRHNISSTNEEGVVTRWPNSITSYPGYVLKTAHNDIAVLSFNPINYTTQIQPICVWENKSTPVTNGIISGWGYPYNDGILSMVPMKADMEAVSLEECRKKLDLLKMLATDRTFCAGGNDVGPCYGDSGSGFYVHHKNKWYLRGIISNSIASSPTACDLSFYSVYVDIVHYLGWIRDVIQKTQIS